MKIVLAEQCVFWTGKIAGYTEKTLMARVQASGARYAAAPNKTATLALIGARASDKKIDQAQALGILCLYDEDIITLLRDGELEYEAPQAETRSLDELLGDVRSILAKPHSHAQWAALCEQVDQCAPEHQEALITYIEAQLSRWPEVVPVDERMMDGGIWDLAAGCLRYMPGTWLTEALRGESHEKFRLCKGLTFNVATLNNAAALPVFNNPAIGHLEIFDVGSASSVTIKKSNFYKAMASAKHMGNVHTLVLTDAPAGALKALHGATSMPKLRAIHLNSDSGYIKEPDKGADIFAAGPWAAQLEQAGVSHAAQLDRLAADLGALPKLTRLVLNGPRYMDAQVAEQLVKGLERMMGQLERIDLSISYLGDYGPIEGYGVLLDCISACPKLKILDISQGTDLTGEQGEVFIKRHILDNGLGAKLEALLVGTSVDAANCAKLREAGVKVQDQHQAPTSSAATPKPQEVAAPSATQATAAAPAAAGEPVTSPSGLSVADFLAFDEPCEEAWKVMISVVQGLEQELEPARFEEAITQLEQALAAWPDHLRRLPPMWYADALATAPNPKLRLARSMWLDLFYAHIDAKQTSSLVQRLAQSKHLGHISWVGLWLDGTQQHMLDAVAALFEATKPDTCVFYQKKTATIDRFKAHLSGLGLLPSNVLSRQPYNERKQDTSLDGLGLRHVSLKIADPDMFTQLIQREDLEHVIALELNMAWNSDKTDGVDWSAMKAVTAKLPQLRYLALSCYELPQAARQLLATWLGQARPLFVKDPLSHTEPYDSPVAALIQAGVYARAYASSITLAAPTPATEIEAMLGHEQLNISGIRLMYSGGTPVSTSTLIASMSAKLKPQLKALHWALQSDEFEQVGQLLEELPALTLWAAQNETIIDDKSRAPLINALANAPGAKRLVKLQLCSPHTKEKLKKLSAAELKLLAKGSGLDERALSQRGIAQIWLT